MPQGPPPARAGGLPIAFALTTGTTSKTGQTISGQGNVICGYCRDVNSTFTGCFEGDPNPACPHNNGNAVCTGPGAPADCCAGPQTGTCFGVCTGAGVPFPCCTGVGTGTCDPQAPKQCFAGTGSPTACTDGNGTWPDCQQRDPGAFGPAGGGAHTITETGTPAGDMTDGAGHASTLVSIFCIQPTFNATVDGAGDLPAPGAVSLFGTAQLLP